MVWEGVPGELVVTIQDGNAVDIARADPCVLLFEALFEEIICYPRAWIYVEPGPDRMSVLGSLLKISTETRKVVYKIIGYIPESHCYIAEWPD